MFDRDQPEIAAYAQSSPDAMCRVMTFVIATIQQSIFTVPEIMDDIDRNGVESRFLWGFKLPAYENAVKEREGIYREAMGLWRAHANPDHAADELLHLFARQPGYGLVKGGFCVQLMFGLSGCIDTHNLQLYEVSARAFKASRYKNGSAELRHRMVRDYNHKCWDIGGTEFLWDNWCRFVADRNATTADRVSRLHTDTIVR